jgi:hypothetical protein
MGHFRTVSSEQMKSDERASISRPARTTTTSTLPQLRFKLAQKAFSEQIKTRFEAATRSSRKHEKSCDDESVGSTQGQSRIPNRPELTRWEAQE